MIELRMVKKTSKLSHKCSNWSKIAPGVSKEGIKQDPPGFFEKLK